MIFKSLIEKLSTTNDSSFSISWEWISTQVKGYGWHAYVKEVLTYNVHLIPLSYLACLKQDEAKLHEDDVDRGNDDPVLEQSVFKFLGLFCVVEICFAVELLGELVAWFFAWLIECWLGLGDDHGFHNFVVWFCALSCGSWIGFLCWCRIVICRCWFKIWWALLVFCFLRCFCIHRPSCKISHWLRENITFNKSVSLWIHMHIICSQSSLLIHYGPLSFFMHIQKHWGCLIPKCNCS